MHAHNLVRFYRAAKLVLQNCNLVRFYITAVLVRLYRTACMLTI